MKKYIVYARVSTKKQIGNTSLKSQLSECSHYIYSVGGSVIETFVEQGSGSKADRTEIIKAVALAKAEGATIIVAKLDRLARELTLVEYLRSNNVAFLAANNPYMNDLTIDILIACAKYERTAINERTKKGKTATIAKYGTLHHKKGTCVNVNDGTRELAKSAIKAKAAANENNKKAYDFIEARMELSGCKLVALLNERGYLTSQGRAFTRAAVQRIKLKVNENKAL